MTQTIFEKIEAFAKAHEALEKANSEKRIQATRDRIDAKRMSREKREQEQVDLVRWHIRDLLDIEPETPITDAEVYAFILRMGPEYLSLRLIGIGSTKAARLFAKAKERAQ